MVQRCLRSSAHKINTQIRTRRNPLSPYLILIHRSLYIFIPVNISFYPQIKWIGHDGSINQSIYRTRSKFSVRPQPHWANLCLHASGKISATRQTYSRLVPDAGASTTLTALQLRTIPQRWGNEENQENMNKSLNRLEPQSSNKNDIQALRKPNPGSCHLRVAPSHWRFGEKLNPSYFFGRPRGANLVFFCLFRER